MTPPRQLSTVRCSYCGVEVPAREAVWTSDGPDDSYACADCDRDPWEGATDVCKMGGPAPCIDDICHALGGCMHYKGGA